MTREEAGFGAEGRLLLAKKYVAASAAESWPEKRRKQWREK